MILEIVAVGALLSGMGLLPFGLKAYAENKEKQALLSRSKQALLDSANRQFLTHEDFKAAQKPKKPKKPKKYTEVDLLTALVVDEIRANPEDWQELNATEGHIGGEFHNGFINKKALIKVRQHHCAHIGKEHKNDVWINEVKATDEHFRQIEEAFNARTVRMELERLGQRRIARQMGDDYGKEETVKIGTLLGHQKVSPSENEKFNQIARKFVHNRRT